MLTTEEKNLVKIVNVEGEISAEDYNIAYVDETEGEITKHLIHQAFKCIPSAGKSKGHPKKLKHSTGSNDSSLLFIFWSHWNLVISFL